MAANPDSNTPKSKSQSRRLRYRTLREDYVQFCGGNVVAALLLDYFASIERLHSEARDQGEEFGSWRTVSGRAGGKLTLLQPIPKRETVYSALAILVDAGLIEPHPDNGRPTPVGVQAEGDQYRLVTRALLELERDWLGVTATPVPERTGPVPQRSGPPVLYGTHESVKEEGEGSAPLQNSQYNPPAIRVLQNDTFAHINGYQLVVAYAEATGTIAETIWAAYQAKQVAAGLAKGGITPEDVAAFIQDLRRTQPGRYNGYRFQYMAEDLPRWKQTDAANSAPSGFWGREFTE